MPAMLGALQAQTTITEAIQGVSEQKFHMLGGKHLYDFMPINAQGGWASELIKARIGINADVSRGFRRSATESNFSKKNAVQVSTDIVRTSTFTYKDTASWNLMEVNEAAASIQRLDLITAKMRALKTVFDLGVQASAFLGCDADSPNEPNLQGLLTQSNVTVNQTLITKRLTEMNAQEMRDFVSKVLGIYQANCGYTAYPDTFLVPMEDKNGGIISYQEAAEGSTFTFTPDATSMLEVLRKKFVEGTGNENFQIMGTIYNNMAIDGTRYALYRKDPDSFNFMFPIAFTQTPVVQVSGTDFVCDVYGRIGGILNARPQETIYFDVLAA